MYEKGQFIIYGVRGVCEVVDITTVDHPGGPEGKLYYVLRPYAQKASKIVAPVDSEKTITRPLLSREEAMALMDGFGEVPELEVPSDKQREERYKEALKTCDCRAWVGMLKTLYTRRCRRIAQGKRMTDLDERYFRSAEDNLCAELSVSLGVPREDVEAYIQKRVSEK